MQNLRPTPFLSLHRLPATPSVKNADPSKVSIPSKDNNGSVQVSVLHSVATKNLTSAAAPLVKKLDDAVIAQSNAKNAVKSAGGGSRLERKMAHIKEKLTLASRAFKPAVQPGYRQYTHEQIENWLFGNNRKGASQLPASQLGKREAARYAPKALFDSVKPLGAGKISSRIGIYSGGITDLKTSPGQTAAVGDSNNGDLLTGCGFAVAKAIVNAAGAGLQRELYNNYGTPGVMETTDYGKKHYSKFEGRGYAISCDAYDMKQSHGIGTVELLTVPMDSEEGVTNMYYEALVHSKDKDYIALPMAGMTHPVINGDAAKSAKLSMKAAGKFYADYPDSKLKIVFTIFNNPQAEAAYQQAISRADAA